MFYKKVIFIFIIFMLTSCANDKKPVKNIISNNNLENEMIRAYNDGVNALNSGDSLYASKKFNEVELLFPQSEWAPRALLMSAYAYWTQQYYSSSISELERFIEVYAVNQNLDYAYYLLAINYYESIGDEKKNLKNLLQSKKYFEIIMERFPNTDYSSDAKYKLDLIQDYLAAKEMYIARHYIKKQKWIPAINRLKDIVNKYNTTVYIEEALYRLVEIHYKIGLKNEAKKYAQTLGYNYESSMWYEASYQIFNKNYKTINKSKKEKKKKNLIDKIKSFF